jgi:hypothetical protein
MPHLPPAHHETSKHDSPNETKIKEKQNKSIPDSNSNLTKSMTHHNQTKELTTWFLTLKFHHEKHSRVPCKSERTFVDLSRKSTVLCRESTIVISLLLLDTFVGQHYLMFFP